MKTTLKALICTALCCAAWSAFAGGPPPPADTITVTAQPSINHVNPSMSGNHWVYMICVPHGGTLSDTLPIRLQGTDNNGTSNSTTVSFSVNGSDLGITAPADFTMSDTDDVTKPIVLNKSGLADGDYAANVFVTVPNQDPFNVVNGHIQILVTVGGCEGPQVTCWFTDSDYNNLFNCDMQEVTGSSGGTFQIVKNARGKVAATNPGQLYYNMLVPTNTTGMDQTVTVTFGANGLSPQGAQAAHAAYIDPVTGFPPETDWLYVNSSGTPCGPSGACTLVVPAGKMLFVTWHLAFSSIGYPAPAAWNNICGDSNNPSVSATGTVSGGLTGSCTATATGYLKQ